MKVFVLTKKEAIRNKLCKGKPEIRTFSSAANASLTIEASLVLPLFIFLVTAVIHLLIILSLQGQIQLAAEEAARDLGKAAYLTREEETFETLGINSLTMKGKILTGGLAKRVSASRIEGGSAGLETYLSSYDSESGILDIVVTYSYRIPYLPKVIPPLRFLQRCQSRVWTGIDITDQSQEGEEEEEQIVYITPSGVAYHKSTACPYLDLSIRAVALNSVVSLRNKSGHTYARCTACSKARTDYGTVYITDYGTNWHASLTCNLLKRTIKEVPLSKVGGRHACPKCAAE